MAEAMVKPRVASRLGPAAVGNSQKAEATRGTATRAGHKIRRSGG